MNSADPLLDFLGRGGMVALGGCHSMSHGLHCLQHCMLNNGEDSGLVGIQ